MHNIVFSNNQISDFITANIIDNNPLLGNNNQETPKGAADNQDQNLEFEFATPDRDEPQEGEDDMGLPPMPEGFKDSR